MRPEGFFFGRLRANEMSDFPVAQLSGQPVPVRPGPVDQEAGTAVLSARRQSATNHRAGSQGVSFSIFSLRFRYFEAIPLASSDSHALRRGKQQGKGRAVRGGRAPVRKKWSTVGGLLLGAAEGSVGLAFLALLRGDFVHATDLGRHVSEEGAIELARIPGAVRGRGQPGR